MDSVAEEVWKDIPGEHGYQISNKGNARTADRYVITKRGVARFLKGQPLNPKNTSHGYRAIGLSKNRKEYVHRLVMRAFFGEQPAGTTDVNHINGIKTDNRLENLEYCSRQHNNQHARKTGLNNSCGENHPSATSTRKQIETAYQLVKDGLTQAEAARIAGVSRRVVSKVVTGKQWGMPRIYKRKSMVTA